MDLILDKEKNVSLIHNEAYKEYKIAGKKIMKGDYTPLLDDFLKKGEELYFPNYQNNPRDKKGLVYHEKLLTIILDIENKINLGLQFGVNHKNLYEAERLKITRVEALEYVKEVLNINKKDVK